MRSSVETSVALSVADGSSVSWEAGDGGGGLGVMWEDRGF